LNKTLRSVLMLTLIAVCDSARNWKKCPRAT